MQGEPQQDGRRMYARLLGEEVGPLSWAELEDLARRGTLSGNDAVRREGESLWVPARHLSELRSLLGGRPQNGGGPQEELLLAQPQASGQTATPEGVGGTDPAPVSAACNEAAGPLAATQFRRRVLLAAAALAPVFLLAAAGVGWYFRRQSLRYPLPARLRQQAARAGRYLLGFGPLSHWEYAIVLVDLLLVAAACGYFIWRFWRGPRVNARQST
jgi:hypothetical protein